MQHFKKLSTTATYFGSVDVPSGKNVSYEFQCTDNVSIVQLKCHEKICWSLGVGLYLGILFPGKAEKEKQTQAVCFSTDFLSTFFFK